MYSQYVIDEVFEFGEFYAVGLVSNPDIISKVDDNSVSSGDNNSVLAIRGTKRKLDDWLNNTDERGIAFNEFEQSYPAIKSWLEKQTSVTITGHSQGGALAQLIAAEWTASGHPLDKVVTYNSPGITKDPVDDKWLASADKCVASRIKEVTHHISVGDIVSMAGEAYIQGDVKLHSYRVNDDYVNNKHTLAFSEDVLLPPEKVAQGVTTRSISTDLLNSFWFNYSDADYIDGWYIWIDQIAFVRGTVESVRVRASLPINTAIAVYEMYGKKVETFKSLGGIFASLKEPVTLTSNNGWSLENINRKHDGWFPADITTDGSSFSGGVVIRTPNGFRIPGLLHYSNYGLDSVSIDSTQCCNGVPLDGSWGGTFRVQNANMTLSNISDIKAMSAAYPSELPNCDYSLDGNMTLSFMSSGCTTAKIGISSLKTIGNSQKLGADVSSLIISSFAGQPLFSLVGSGKNFTFDGTDRLTGQGNFSFTLYDRNGNTWTSQTVTTNDSKFSFFPGYLGNSFTVSGNDLSLFGYVEGIDGRGKPSLRYGGKLYFFNDATGRWEGQGTVSSTSSFSASANLSAMVSNGTSVTVSVSPLPMPTYFKSLSNTIFTLTTTEWEQTELTSDRFSFPK